MVPIQYRPSGQSVKAIADDIEAAIRSERLIPGALLPSVRGLADELAVAPGTVAGAYANLRDRGLTESRGRRGTFIRDRPPVGTRSIRAAIAPGVVDLAGGQPSPRLLPSLTAAILANLRGPAPAPVDGLLPTFAAAAADRLAADGVPADHLTASAGGLDGIRRVLSAQLRGGDAVGVEDPGWPNLLDLVAALGLRPIPITMDERGPRPESLGASIRAGSKAVIITSRAHNPTGAFVDAPRRAALASVLNRQRDVLVIEDDHAAELAAVDLCPLAGLTTHWAFVRSSSKPYGPDLRLGVIAGDPETIGRVSGRLRAGSGWISTLTQRIQLGLWASRPATDHVAAAGRTYDARRTALIEAFAEAGVEAVGASGLNVWVPVRDEADVVAQLLRSGWAVAPGARFRQQSGPGIRVTVSNLSEPMIPALAESLRAATGTRPAGGYAT